ncbi:hypothetical protein ACFT2C_15845 [Promicromonospora sp. NPDC057138]|uniref:hypothetical protein n=1 Tax=Promicromonospora sp. NPDC057138 TaxID=3346031 RepID=UPI00362C7196
MHVSYLRSSVICDALVRVLGHLGADVTRQNTSETGAPSSACSSSGPPHLLTPRQGARSRSVSPGNRSSFTSRKG